MLKSRQDSIRYAELDVLRGFAALSVVCFHYTSNYVLRFYQPENAVLFLFPLGKYGVHLFFMISGFVILLTLEKTAHIFDFIVSRFSRLYPCYWAAILISSLVMKYCLLLPSLRMHVSVSAIAVNCSMLQSWFHVADLDTVYWTLATEITFYALMALVFMTVGMKYVELLGVGWLCLMVIHKYLSLTGTIGVSVVLIFSSLLQYGNLFFAGILFYNLKTKGSRWYRHGGIVLCGLVQYLIWFDIERQAFFIFIFCVFIFYLFIINRLYFLVQKPLVFLGGISYSLYLVHQNIGYILMQWIDCFGHNRYLMFVLPLSCSLLIATLMTYLIEKPALKYIRLAYKGGR